MYAIDEVTRQRFYDLSRLVNDVSGDLSPEIVAASAELDFQHGLFLHPSPLRTIALWVERDVWHYRFLDLNIVDRTVYRVSETDTLAPVGHQTLPELVARLLAKTGRDIVSSIADKVIVPRENVSEVFDSHIAGAAKTAFCARAWLTRNGYQADW